MGSDEQILITAYQKSITGFSLFALSWGRWISAIKGGGGHNCSQVSWWMGCGLCSKKFTHEGEVPSISFT